MQNDVPGGEQIHDVAKEIYETERDAEDVGDLYRTNLSTKNNSRIQTASYMILIDICVTLFQKIGLWDHNILSNFDLPVFRACMGWVKFPALGWDLALNLPEVATGIAYT